MSEYQSQVLQDLEDIKGTHDLRLPWTDIAITMAVLFILIGVLAYIVRYLRGQKKIQKEILTPVKPVHWGIEVKETLGRLSCQSPHDFEELRQNYFDLSAVLKTVLEKLSDSNMTDLTSREIIERLSALDASLFSTIPTEEWEAISKQVKEFYSRADLLLFAKQQIGSKDYMNDCAWVTELFKKTLKIESQLNALQSKKESQHEAGILLRNDVNQNQASESFGGKST